MAKRLGYVDSCICGPVDGFFCVRCRHYLSVCRCGTFTGGCVCPNDEGWASKGERVRVKQALNKADIPTPQADFTDTEEALIATVDVQRQRIVALEAELTECKDILKLKTVAMLRQVMGDKELADLIDGYETQLRRIRQECKPKAGKTIQADVILDILDG